MSPLSLYIHVPWCIRKCPYCDFNSHAVNAELPEQAYIQALLSDLRNELELAQLSYPHVETVFIGGGTPSLLSPSALQQLFNGLTQQLSFSANCEITMEANPGSVESAKFRAFRELGINRLSIGIQSFHDKHLHTLGRIHDANEARQATMIARQAGFDNLNLDVMFGLPEQSEAEMLADINTAIALQPSHISFYQLTLEPNTYFHKFPPPLPDDDRIFSAQQRCQAVLAEHGYMQYEISAYAPPGFECRHNRNYWQFGDYLGIGAGAHGKLSMGLPAGILRTTKLRRPEQYMLDPGRGTREVVSVEHLPLEFVMNHLRLKNGFSLQHYQDVTGLTPNTLNPALNVCIDQGLLMEHQGTICCTQRGWNFLDEILEKFMP